MKKSIVLLISLIVLGMTACKNGDGLVQPPSGSAEDWSFPANDSKYSITLIVSKRTAAVGDEFTVDCVCYNLKSVFGASVVLNYDASAISVRGVEFGPYLKTGNGRLGVYKNEPAKNSISAGITGRAGIDSTVDGSGILLRLRCRAAKSGSYSLTIDHDKLKVVKSDGNPIPEFQLIEMEGAGIIIQ